MIRASFNGRRKNFGHLHLPIWRPTRRHEKSAFASYEDLLIDRRKAIECKSSSSSCDWSRLPEDLWVEIFYRVPQKGLRRYKAVCKLWKKSISIVCALKRVPCAPLRGFIFKVINSKYEPSLDYKVHKRREVLALGPVATCSALLPFKPSSSDFLGYCNGLQLFIQSSSQQYYVCNSTTKQCVAIPTCSQVQNFRFSSLTFDPSKSLHFKLICFESVSPSIKYYIFSSDTCRWDMHHVLFEHPATEHNWRMQSVYSNGVLYHLSESKHLICFDINQLNVCAIDLPEKERTNTFGHTRERGQLYYSGYNSTNIFIWMLEGYCDGGSWILVQKISLGDLESRPMYTWNRCDLRITPYFIYHTATPTVNLIATGTPEVVVIYSLSKSKVCHHWWMNEDDHMALGQGTFWPHRGYSGSIYLNHVD